MCQREVVVVGSGPSGVAAALSVRDRGLRPLLIDRADQVGASWRDRYDRLKLNTPRDCSHLPGRPYPPGTPILPTRRDVVSHLQRHANEDGIELCLDTEVQRIDRGAGGWTLVTSGGLIEARHIVVATGYEHTPAVPEWPGKELYGGELLHSAEYRNPLPYAGKRVLVVGGGSSGFEIAHDVAAGGAACTWLSVRTPPNILPLWGSAGRTGDAVIRIAGKAPRRMSDPLFKLARRVAYGNLAPFGLPTPSDGPLARAALTRRSPAVVDRRVIDAIRGGAIEVVAGVETLDADTVLLSGGRRVDPEVVIAATGYRRGLETLVGHLDVLDEHGVPREGGEVAAADGLWFVGFFCRPTLIGFVAEQSVRFAARIAADLHRGAGADQSGELSLDRA